VRWKIKCSVCPAIRTDYRSLLRSSSTGNPSDPPLVVVYATWDFFNTKSACNNVSVYAMVYKVLYIPSTQTTIIDMVWD